MYRAAPAAVMVVIAGLVLAPSAEASPDIHPNILQKQFISQARSAGISGTDSAILKVGAKMCALMYDFHYYDVMPWLVKTYGLTPHNADNLTTTAHIFLCSDAPTRNDPGLR